MAAQPAPAVEDFGGTTLPNGVRLNGWRVETCESSIASVSELATIKDRLRAETGVTGPLPKLPEAIFAKNLLKLVHERSGLTISFGAEDALVQWFRNSIANGAGGLTVPAAKLGSWTAKKADQSKETGAADDRGDWDWTYSTEYTGIEEMDGADAQPLPWTPHTGDGIDMALLRRREPILFFADVPLYQDDLHDNGASEARVRLRMMPSCFFLLYRHWLRIDGMLVRQRDVRIFQRYGGGGGPGPLLRHKRVAQMDLPPLPPPPDGEELGRVGGGGSEDTPRAPMRAVLPDEQVSAERLAAVPAQMEAVEEIVLDSLPDAAA